MLNAFAPVKANGGTMLANRPLRVSDFPEKKQSKLLSLRNVTENRTRDPCT